MKILASQLVEIAEKVARRGWMVQVSLRIVHPSSFHNTSQLSILQVGNNIPKLHLMLDFINVSGGLINGDVALMLHTFLCWNSPYLASAMRMQPTLQYHKYFVGIFA